MDSQPAIRCPRKCHMSLRSEAPVDRFSLRSDQTPGRASSLQGATDRDLKFSRFSLYRYLTHQTFTLFKSPSESSWLAGSIPLSSVAVLAIRRARAGLPAASYTPPMRSFSSSDSLPRFAHTPLVPARHNGRATRPTGTSIVWCGVNLLG